LCWDCRGSWVRQLTAKEQASAAAARLDLEASRDRAPLPYPAQMAPDADRARGRSTAGFFAASQRIER
jgi:hypothetical protein